MSQSNKNMILNAVDSKGNGNENRMLPMGSGSSGDSDSSYSPEASREARVAKLQAAQFSDASNTNYLDAAFQSVEGGKSNGI